MVTIVENGNLQILRDTAGPYKTNTYIVICAHSQQSIIVDAPGAPSRIISLLKRTTPRYLLLTHNHEDHTGALETLRSRLGVPLAAHELDAPVLDVVPDILLDDGDTLSFGKLEIKVIHLPGHSRGSLGFLIGKYLMSGDTLFPGGPGATWSPEDFQQILRTITGKLFTLPDETIILPGHGEGTTIGESKMEYAAFASREHPSDLFGDVLWESS